MPVRQLYDAKAIWEKNGDITIKWDPARMEGDRYIIFSQIKNSPTGILFLSRLVVDLKFEMNNSAKTLKSAVPDPGVHKITFIAFSSPEKEWNEPEIRRACVSSPGFLISAMAGQADITYSMREANIGEASAVTISLDLSSAIEGDMLGYRYFCGVQILQAFPALKQGTTELPPIIVPKGSAIEIVPYRPEYTENLHIREKKKFLGLF